jgi:hypothetical protein
VAEEAPKHIFNDALQDYPEGEGAVVAVEQSNEQCPTVIDQS